VAAFSSSLVAQGVSSAIGLASDGFLTPVVAPLAFGGPLLSAGLTQAVARRAEAQGSFGATVGGAYAGFALGAGAAVLVCTGFDACRGNEALSWRWMWGLVWTGFTSTLVTTGSVLANNLSARRDYERASRAGPTQPTPQAGISFLSYAGSF
jgi:hypothetical protein